MRRLTIAMLSAQEVQTVADVVDIMQERTELDMVGSQAEDAMAEATQIQTDINQAQQAIDDTEEVLQEVEEERQVLEQAQQQGGIDKPAMEALQRAFSRFEKRTGVSCAIRSMGLEAFSAKSTRAHSTAVAMEDAKEFIKKIMESLINALSAVWGKVKDFLDKILVGTDRLIKRANVIKSAAEEAEGKVAPSDAKIKIASVLAFTRQNNKTVEGKAFAKTYVEQTKEFDENTALAKKYSLMAINGPVFSKLLDDVSVKDNKKAIIDFSVLNNAAALKDTVSNKLSGLIHLSGKRRLLGDYIETGTIIDENTTWELLSENYNKIYYGFYKVGFAPEKVHGEVTPMTIADAMLVTERVAEHMASYSKLRQEHGVIEAELKKIVSKAKELEKAQDAEIDQIRVGVGLIRSIINSGINMRTSLRLYDINLAKATLDYAAASIRAANGETQKA